MNEALRTLGEGTLRAYAQVLFSSRLDVGALLLGASFVVPSVGLVGLGGALLAGALALALGFDRESVRSGALGYNALLVFLGMGAMLDRSPAFCALALVAAAGTVLVHAATSAALAWHLRLPALSLPFVLAGWLVLATVPHLRGMALRSHPPALELGAFAGPPWLDLLLKALGGIFFQPHWTAGLLVLAALALHSRISVVHALVGFGVGQLLERYVLALPGPGLLETAGFNLVLTAVVLGGVYYVPGPASLVVAAGGALAAGLLSVALGTLLAPVGMPVLAMPFNVVVLGTLYALAQRTRQTGPRPADRAAVSPEEVLAWYRTRVHRFYRALPVRLQLPFRGAWTCTQGNDGAHTHQGPWRHGLDFEVLDEAGHRGGPSLADHGCWHLPVLAPAAGTVVRVVDGLPDNPPGEQDTVERWGNLVVVQHAPALFSLMAHLSPATIVVKPGDYVVPGQLLARCGSSGRSPVPHLHFQVQSTPEPGAPTTGIELADVVVEDGRDARLVRRCLPAEGERVRNVAISGPLAQALALPPGLRLVLETVGGGREVVESTLDLLGQRVLRSDRGAELVFDVQHDGLVALDVSGPRSSALFLLHAALLRVPFDDAPRLRWDDVLERRHRVARPVGWLLDAASAFLAAPEDAVSFRMLRDGGVIAIEGEAAGGLLAPALRTRAEVIPGVGLARVLVTRGGRSLEVRVTQEAA